MRYSYEFKKKCIELYRKGKYPKTPNDIDSKVFHKQIRRWVRTVEKMVMNRYGLELMIKYGPPMKSMNWLHRY